MTININNLNNDYNLNNNNNLNNKRQSKSNDKAFIVLYYSCVNDCATRRYTNDKVC